jgi:hypothetical protein
MSSNEASVVGDPVQAALSVVTDVGEKTAVEGRALAEESRRASHERADGATVTAIMVSGRFQRVLRLGEEMAKDLLGATSALRKVLVRQMNGEGERVASISRLFEVSHQRISTLLRAPSGKGRP